MNERMISYHVINGNIGDRLCGPIPYFDDLSHYPVRKVETFYGSDSKVSVFGGGGMLTSGIGDLLYRARKEASRSVLWGVGTNYRDCQAPIIPSWVKDFTLVGIRDWGVEGFEYVPCASCMHPLFNDPAPAPSIPVVVYAHHSFPIPKLHLPYLTNGIFGDSMDTVIKFLSFGKTVVTNSYHGAYWAMLLGRSVVLWEPNTSKYFHFKHQPVQCNKPEELEEALAIATPPPSGYLEECRSINMAFKERVMEVINEA